MKMKKYTAAIALVAGLGFGQAEIASAQHVAGGVIIEYNDIDMAIVANGWSVMDLLRGNVHNDLGDFIGYVHDAIVTPDGQTTFVIINVAGFLNIGDKLVAIPSLAFEVNDDGDLVLPFATKDALKSLPQFKYAK